MATPSRRSSRSRRSTRRGRGDVDRADARAIAAIRRELATPGPAARIGKLLTDQAAAARPDRRELNPAARRQKAAFDREGKMLATRISAEMKVMDDKWGPVFDQTIPPQRDLLHVYGADVAGTGGPFLYRLSWVHIDGFSGAGIGGSADPKTGKFWASHYTIGTQQNAYAGIGVRLTPSLQWCRLSVRPYVNWSGFDILRHKVYDPQLNEHRWALAGAELGIIVQSWNPAGGAYNVDARHWVNLWKSAEQNPDRWRDYADTASSSTGLQVDVLATKMRQYAIWVCCRAWVIADSGFAVATRSSSSVSCHLPFLVVEEVPSL